MRGVFLSDLFSGEPTESDHPINIPIKCRYEKYVAILLHVYMSELPAPLQLIDRTGQCGVLSNHKFITNESE